MQSRHPNLKIYLGYILAAIVVVLLFATIQIRFMMGVAFDDVKPGFYLVPFIVGGLFGFLIARVRILYLRSQTYLAQLEKHEQQLESEIRERLGVELSLREQGAKLNELNQDLKAFSSSVSHDLRTPLRSISGFANILQQDYAGQLDDVAREHIRRILHACASMDELIEALLSMARASQAELNKTECDVSKMAQQIITVLQESEPQRQVEVLIQPGLAAVADRSLLNIVLFNLISNAWKYTARSGKACIEVGRMSNEQGGDYYVGDNGAGFRQDDAAKVFEPFARLHDEADFQGTGIGLVTVQRIIHRHGGEIRAKAEVDKGATFYFSLPAQ